MAFETERSNADRRMTAIECAEHKAETDRLQSMVDKNSGRWTAMLWFLGVIGTVLSVGMVTLITKTSDIQTLLGKNDVTLMQHTERIETLRRDVDDLKELHRYTNQQTVVKRDYSNTK
jgi:cell division protein FtsL